MVNILQKQRQAQLASLEKDIYGIEIERRENREERESRGGWRDREEDVSRWVLSTAHMHAFLKTSHVSDKTTGKTTTRGRMSAEWQTRAQNE